MALKSCQFDWVAPCKKSWLDQKKVAVKAEGGKAIDENITRWW